MLKALLYQWADAKRNNDVVTSSYLRGLAERVRVRFLLFSDRDKARRYKWQHKERNNVVVEANELFGHYRIWRHPSSMYTVMHTVTHTVLHNLCN